LAVLTGKIDPISISLISESEKSKFFELENELNENQKELKQFEQRKSNNETLTKRDEDFQSFLIDRIKLLKEQLNQKERELIEKIDKLKM